MDTEIVDRYARAIADAVLPNAAPRWDGLSDAQRDGYRDLARKVIENLAA